MADLTVRLTPQQAEVLLSAAIYYEAELDAEHADVDAYDQPLADVERRRRAATDRAVLDRAARKLTRALAGRTRTVHY